MRSEAELIAGLVDLQLGGESKTLRVLRIDEQAKWEKKLGGALDHIAQMDFNNAGQVAEAARKALGMLSTPRLMEFLIAYDVEGKLGGRQWLEGHATAEQVYRAMRDIVMVAFPFVEDARTLAAQVQTLTRSVRSMPASSTNLPSPSGASTQKPSAAGSP